MSSSIVSAAADFFNSNNIDDVISEDRVAWEGKNFLFSPYIDFVVNEFFFL